MSKKTRIDTCEYSTTAVSKPSISLTSISMALLFPAVRCSVCNVIVFHLHSHGISIHGNNITKRTSFYDLINAILKVHKMYLRQRLWTCVPKVEIWLPQYLRKACREIGPGIPFTLARSTGSFSSPRRLKFWSCSASGTVGSCIGGPSRWSSMSWVTSFRLCLALVVWPARVIDIFPVSLFLYMKHSMDGVEILYTFYLTLRLLTVRVWCMHSVVAER